MAENKEQIPFRASDERKQELKLIALKRRMTVQRLIELALELYLQGHSSTDIQKTKDLTRKGENSNVIIQAVAALEDIIRSATAAIGTISPGRSSGTHTLTSGEDDELDAAVREVEAEAKKVRQAAKRTGGSGGAVRKRPA